MKKRLLYRLPIYLLCLIFLSGVTGCADMSDERAATEVSTADELPDISAGDFADGSFVRDAGYGASFQTKYIRIGDVTVHIASSIFSEEESPALARQLAEHYAALKQLAGRELPQLSVYVVRKTVTGGAAVMDEDRLFCTQECVDSGDIAIYLAQVGLGISQYWQCVSICDMLRADSAKPDEDAIAAYYSGGEHTAELSLCPIFFREDIAAEETAVMTRQTADALADYIISQYGMDIFLAEGENPRYCGEWLDSIGVEDLDLSELETDAAAMVRKLSWTFQGDGEAVAESELYSIQFPRLDWLPTAKDIYGFLLYYLEGMQAVRDKLAAEAPEYYARLSAGRINVIMSNDVNTRSTANPEMGRVIVTDYESAIHETVHCLIPYYGGYGEMSWVTEGIAVYFEAPLYPLEVDESHSTNLIFHWILTGELDDELSGEAKELRDWIVLYYEALSGGSAAEVTDYEALFDAFAYAALFHPEISDRVTDLGPITNTMWAQYRVNEDDRHPGNRLTYYESRMFLMYLIDQYGLDAVVAIGTDPVAYHEMFPDAGAFNQKFDEFMGQLVIEE